MSDTVFDASAFRAFEIEGWAARAGGYHQFFGPISARVVDPLLDAAQVGPGLRVLDLATGPGYVAARAAARDAVVIGIDVSASMVALASTLHPGLAFQQADAERLPFAANSFDAVVGNLLIHHLAEPERAVAEAARVLAPGGSLALTVWDVPAKSRLMGLIVDGVQAAGAGPPLDLPPGPPTFKYSEDGAFTMLLRGAGLVDVTIQPIAFIYHLPDIDAYWDGMLRATVRTAALVERQPPEARQRIRAAVERLTAPYMTQTGLDIPVAIKLAVGRRAV